MPGRSTAPLTQNSFGPGRLLGADLGERRAALEHDRHHVDERLDVVDHRRLPEQALDDRERRLVARLAAVALDRAEDRGLLAADVRAGALAHLDVEGEAVAEHVAAEIAPLARLLDRVLDPVLGERILAAHVEVAVLAAGRVRGDRHRLDHGERVALHDHAVLERAGLGLVGVADQVVRAARLARDGVPLAPHRERGAAAADEVGVDDLADHALGAEVDRPPQRVVAAVGAVVVEAVGVDAADPPQQPQLRVAELRRRRSRAAAGASRRRGSP